MSSGLPARAAIAVSALAAALAATPAAAAEITWDARYYDPRPADDGGDFLLPMPCGGAMAFRRIETPAGADWLLDEQVRLGSPAIDDLSYAEYLRTEYIVGSLTEDGARLFYIGKYEITRDQWQAVMDPTCPEPSMRGRVAMGGISWFEGVDFSRRYTEWLLQNAPDALPHEEGEAGFLRLPLETEWEYVARGGNAVAPQDFRRPVFPMDGPLSDYAWYQGADSAGGSVRPVGLLGANPLGVYDMLGNVEEIVLDPFRMNRAGRVHGQAGGFMTKGGSILTADSRIRSSIRTEYNYYDETSGAATRLDTFGLRLLISAPVSTSTHRLEEIRESWEQVPRLRIETDGLDPVEALGELSQLAEDAILGEGLSRIEEDLRDQEATRHQQQQELLRREAELRDQVAAMAESLGVIQTSLREELAARNDAEARAAQALLYAGAVMIRRMREDDRRVFIQERALQAARAIDQTVQANRERADGLERLVEAARENYRISTNAYFYFLIETGETYRPELLEQQVAVVSQIFSQLADSGARMEGFIAFAELFAEQAMAYGRTGELDQDALVAQILQL
ncbi:MAG: SUMF1/EgtB/PvdO family nonheme iron enzyme [Rhodospirillaceae bacterium]|nr:SUMF1/EgtB/PvdO family nonheme iron enzyme [Rhodospirillaceae bacterium]